MSAFLLVADICLVGHLPGMDDWLADIVVLNETRDEARAGDVSVFRSAGEACAYLEHWWVENGEGFAFTAAGHRLTLGVDASDSVIVVGRDDATPSGVEVVRDWLRAYAAAVLEARRAKARIGKTTLGGFEQSGQLPESTEGLIAYVGFSR